MSTPLTNRVSVYVCVFVCMRVRAFVRAWDGYECRREYARAYVCICVSVYVCACACGCISVPALCSQECVRV